MIIDTIFPYLVNQLPKPVTGRSPKIHTIIS